MPKIRLGETSNVPLVTDGRKVWFLLQHIESSVVVSECLSGKFQNKKLLARLPTAGPGLKVYAVWNGKHYTDLFEIDIPVMIERLVNLKKRKKTGKKPKR